MTRIAGVLVALCATASAQAQSSVRVLGVDVTGMDRSVRPQDDFFRFVNGAWNDRTLRRVVFHDGDAVVAGRATGEYLGKRNFC